MLTGTCPKYSPYAWKMADSLAWNTSNWRVLHRCWSPNLWFLRQDILILSHILANAKKSTEHIGCVKIQLLIIYLDQPVTGQFSTAHVPFWEIYIDLGVEFTHRNCCNIAPSWCPADWFIQLPFDWFVKNGMPSSWMLIIPKHIYEWWSSLIINQRGFWILLPTAISQ